jgi:hypothetical protein
VGVVLTTMRRPRGAGYDRGNRPAFWQSCGGTVTDSNPAVYFGRQVRKSRLARGWNLAEFGQRIGYDSGQISRVENGRRAPTELFAHQCDRVFPERDGWFSDFYAESRGWLATPSWFRSWAPHEQAATSLRVWTPGIIHGLLQTEDYARAILSAAPGATDAVVAELLAARMERQRAVLFRDEPPSAWFLMDAAALRRCVGSPEIMADQLRHLAGLARLPHVTIQVVPETEHAGLLGGFIVAGSMAAYAESVVSGHVFEDSETVSALVVRFDTIRNEAHPRRTSLELLDRGWQTNGLAEI